MTYSVHNDLSDKFSKGIIVIHWLTALLILVLFVSGLSLKGLEVSEKMDLLKFHASLGTLFFLLTIIRSILFFKSRRPADLKTSSRFNDILAVWIHNVLYVLMLLLGISGIATMIIGGYGDALQTGDLSLIKPREDIASLKAHTVLSFLTIGLVVLHIIGVIKHFILTKENTLKRIF